jgi:hypothetical protein
MTRPHDAEVPVIDRRDFGQPEALGDDNNRRVDDAQRKIQISVHQFGHARDVVVFPFRDREAIPAERPQEDHFRPRSHP